MASSMWMSSISLLMLIILPLMCESLGTSCWKKSFNDGTHILVGSDLGRINVTVSGCISPETLSALKEDSIVIVHCNDQNVPNLFEAAVANISALESLFLERNKIKRIERGAFTNLRLLKQLDLGDNEIEVLEDEIFIHIPNLLFLTMSRNNLQHFESNRLGSQSLLRGLDLSHNSIHALSRYSFKDLNKLQLLAVGYNQIRYVDEKSFDGLSNLKALGMSYNQIKHLPDTLFVSNSQLEVLNLYHNNLSYISDEVLESLRNIKQILVLYNPWLCGCYDKIAEWAKSKPTSVLSNDGVLCDGGIDVQDGAVCVITDETRCIPNHPEDLLSVLISEQGAYDCHGTLLTSVGE